MLTDCVYKTKDYAKLSRKKIYDTLLWNADRLANDKLVTAKTELKKPCHLVALSLFLQIQAPFL